MLRLLLFLGCLLALRLVGLRGLPLLVLALLLSGGISLVLLNRQRDAMSAVLVDRARRVGTDLDAGARAEDHEPRDAQPPVG